MNYDAASRLTTSTAGGVTTTYTFDSNGNLADVNEAETLTTMVYDKENRLKEHRQGAAENTRTFTYDLNSLKQSETVSKVTDQLVWDGADMLGEVPAVKPVGAPTMPIRYDSGQGIMFATTRFEPAATRTDTGADFIGSILIDFDEAGDFVAERRYKPYGELLAGTATLYGWTGNTGSRATLLQYAEQYNRRRHYSTELKQWTTRDPIWPREHVYGYVNAGPLTWADPKGLSPGGDLINCIRSWVQLGFSAGSACLRCKVAQGYKGGFSCESQPDSGKPVLPWIGPPATLPVAHCTISINFPYGGLLDPGSAACDAMCMGSKPPSIFDSAQRKWCKTLCKKIRQGGCQYLEQYCGTLCLGGQKLPCESCLAFYDASGCPASSVSG